MISQRMPLIVALILCLPFAASHVRAQVSAQIAQDVLPDAPSGHLAANLRPDTSIYPQLSQQSIPSRTQSLPPPGQNPATSPSHNTPPATDESEKPLQKYNLHAQYTFTGMADTSFSAQYSNPAYLVYGTGSSLPTKGQARETESADVYFGYRLLANTEFHVDALFLAGLRPEQYLRHGRLP